jgi:hypothetical protein
MQQTVSGYVGPRPNPVMSPGAASDVNSYLSPGPYSESRGSNYHGTAVPWYNQQLPAAAPSGDLISVGLPSQQGPASYTLSQPNLDMSQYPVARDMSNSRYPGSWSEQRPVDSRGLPFAAGMGLNHPNLIYSQLSPGKYRYNFCFVHFRPL